MSETIRVLGQVAPAANTNTTLYTVPVSRAAVVSSLIICNRDVRQGVFHVAIRPNGAALANQHFIYFNAPLPASSTLTMIAGVTLAATDVVTVWSSSANFSFNLYGSEVLV